MTQEDTFNWLFDDNREPDISKEIKKESESKFEVDQIVRILHNPRGIEGEFYKGQRGTILSIGPDNIYYHVGTCDGNKWAYPPEWIEPFKPRPLKVGDTVKIKSRKWYNKYCNSTGDIRVYQTFISQMAELCGGTYKIAVILSGILGPYYILNEPMGYMFSEEMFE